MPAAPYSAVLPCEPWKAGLWTGWERLRLQPLPTGLGDLELMGLKPPGSCSSQNCPGPVSDWPQGQQGALLLQGPTFSTLRQASLVLRQSLQQAVSPVPSRACSPRAGTPAPSPAVFLNNLEVGTLLPVLQMRRLGLSEVSG